VAACKFTRTRTSLLTINKSDLPVTCKLKNPPAGVTIAAAEFFDSAGDCTDLSVNGQSFVIPNTVATGAGDLEVRIQGGTFPIPAIDVVEDCDNSQYILTIADPNSKLGRTDVVVQQ
jgi:hypothetical protein